MGAFDPITIIIGAINRQGFQMPMR